MLFRSRAGRGEDESSGRRVDSVAIKFEHGVAAQHEKELLVRGGVALVVLVDDEVSSCTRSPSSHSERRDTEVVSDRQIATAGVVKFLYPVQMRNRVSSHGPAFPFAVAGEPTRQASRSVEVSSLTNRRGTTHSAGPAFAMIGHAESSEEVGALPVLAGG